MQIPKYICPCLVNDLIWLYCQLQGMQCTSLFWVGSTLCPQSTLADFSWVWSIQHLWFSQQPTRSSMQGLPFYYHSLAQQLFSTVEESSPITDSFMSLKPELREITAKFSVPAGIGLVPLNHIFIRFSFQEKKIFREKKFHSFFFFFTSQKLLSKQLGGVLV